MLWGEGPKLLVPGEKPTNGNNNEHQKWLIAYPKSCLTYHIHLRAYYPYSYHYQLWCRISPLVSESRYSCGPREKVSNALGKVSILYFFESMDNTTAPLSFMRHFPFSPECRNEARTSDRSCELSNLTPTAWSDSVFTFSSLDSQVSRFLQIAIVIKTESLQEPRLCSSKMPQLQSTKSRLTSNNPFNPACPPYLRRSPRSHIEALSNRSRIPTLLKKTWDMAYLSTVEE